VLKDEELQQILGISGRPSPSWQQPPQNNSSNVSTQRKEQIIKDIEEEIRKTGKDESIFIANNRYFAD